MILLFWCSLFLVFYAYLGYPLSLAAIALFRSRKEIRDDREPFVTLIVTAHNEEKRIREKLENTVRLDYPRDRLQILVASDGSTDRTNAISAEYAAEGVELLDLRDRGGKENAQKEAVLSANGEILVFTDVATMLQPDGLRRILSRFADPTVGCVSSEDRIVGKDGTPSGESFYVRYEMWLRRLESRVHSLVGLSGSFFAARREVCVDFSSEMQSDFRTLLNCVRAGLRGVCEPDAVGEYIDVGGVQREYERKVRTVLRGITVFLHHPEFLNVLEYGIFSYQYFCHKLLRWSVPAFLLVAFASNMVLSTGGSVLYLGSMMCQVVFYSLAFWGWRNPGREGLSLPVKIPTYFLSVNASVAVAWWRYARGVRVVMWAPSDR